MLEQNMKGFLVLIEMGNLLKQTSPLRNPWLNNSVFLDEKKILQKILHQFQ